MSNYNKIIYKISTNRINTVELMPKIEGNIREDHRLIVDEISMMFPRLCRSVLHKKLQRCSNHERSAELRKITEI